jgi:G3E family GTPase
LETLEEQVCFADKILLNKTDLSNTAELTKIEAALRKLNPTAPILRCENGKFYSLLLVIILYQTINILPLINFYFFM